MATGGLQVSGLQQALPPPLLELVFADGFAQSRDFLFAGEFISQVLKKLQAFIVILLGPKLACSLHTLEKPTSLFALYFFRQGLLPETLCLRVRRFRF